LLDVVSLDGRALLGNLRLALNRDGTCLPLVRLQINAFAPLCRPNVSRVLLGLSLWVDLDLANHLAKVFEAGLD